MCAALTVPKGKVVPATGFPVVVYAHGTGGSYRDHIDDTVAGVLARATPPMAVLGYDQVEHGPRRGASTASPNTLFFNFANPAAARGNPMQGAADVITMGRFAKTIALPASLTGGARRGEGRSDCRRVLRSLARFDAREPRLAVHGRLHGCRIVRQRRELDGRAPHENVSPQNIRCGRPVRAGRRSTTEPASSTAG